ncbi:hypothetical protein EVAR_7513_1 [Eumeta japonica]|uniref:Uncharacterized protein n=1 Tax=Eumeta variegata TaxID=151549 RepID=A0A4C2A7J8_EUMVA|nr:hypothetical protein EVAR_7513_1 [Eumeta japonica]
MPFVTSYSSLEYKAGSPNKAVNRCVGPLEATVIDESEAASRLKPGGLLDLVTRKWKIFESAGTDNEAGPALRSIRLELGVSRVPREKSTPAHRETAGAHSPPEEHLLGCRRDALSAPNRRREMGVHYAELLGGSQLKGTTDGVGRRARRRVSFLPVGSEANFTTDRG